MMQDNWEKSQGPSFARVEVDEVELTLKIGIGIFSNLRNKANERWYFVQVVVENLEICYRRRLKPKVGGDSGVNTI